MANIISILFGVVALLLAIPAFIPFIGWLNWLIILIAALGAGIGALSDRRTGRNFCLIVMGVSAFRLWIGGGFI